MIYCFFLFLLFNKFEMCKSGEEEPSDAEGTVRRWHGTLNQPKLQLLWNWLTVCYDYYPSLVALLFHCKDNRNPEGYHIKWRQEGGREEGKVFHLLHCQHKSAHRSKQTVMTSCPARLLDQSADRSQHWVTSQPRASPGRLSFQPLVTFPTLCIFALSWNKLQKWDADSGNDKLLSETC